MSPLAVVTITHPLSSLVDNANTIAKNEQQLAVFQSAPTRQVSQVELAAQATLHVRIEAQATATAAISSIAVSTSIRAAAPNLTTEVQSSPRDFVLYGDSGLLIQSNNAAATIGRLLLPVVYPTHVAPAVTPVAAITPPRIRLVAR